MNKLIRIVILLALSNNLAFGFMEGLEPPNNSFGPRDQLRPADVLDFGKPSQMMNILPNKPVAAKDKYGNRVYFSPNGKLMLSVAEDGSKTFSLGRGNSIKKDVDGQITETTEIDKNDPTRIVVKNGKGEIIEYQQLGYGGKVIATSDADENITKIYSYDAYGKNVDYVLDELTMTKTVFGATGQPKYDINFEGATVATYHYDERDVITYKDDQYGNKTYFSKHGALDYTVNNSGEKTNEYFYKLDADGNNILEKSVDVTPGQYFGDVTYFKNGKQTHTESRFGGTVKEYHYDRNVLEYSFDDRTNETTWYDKNGKALYTSFNDIQTKVWLYYKSRIVGFYDDIAKTAVLFQYGRQDRLVKVMKESDIPTADQIENYYESNGLMADIGKSSIDKNYFLNNTAVDVASKINKVIKKGDNKPRETAVFKTITNIAAGPELPNNTGISLSKYHYSTTSGKLESVVTRDPFDGSGITTLVYVDDEKANQNERSYITLTGDQSNNVKAVKDLWNTIVNIGQNISDISSGNSTLAKTAQSVKDLIVNARVLANLDDTQLCDLFGWNKTASGTQNALEDTRLRCKNAGAGGTFQITYGFDKGNTGTKIYAAAIAATDIDQFSVSGKQHDIWLNLTTEESRLSVTTAGNAVVSTSGKEILTAKVQTAEFTQTINGVTRSYNKNGVIISSINNKTNERSFFDSIGRIIESYASSDYVLPSRTYNYGSNGSLESMVSIEQGIGRVTTFFFGFGAPSDQTTITVFGDQHSNPSAAQAIWNTIKKGTNISEISAGESNRELYEMAKTIRKVTVNSAIVQSMDSQQLCNLLGWDMSAENTPARIADVIARAQNAGVEGKVSIEYAFENDNSGKYLYALTIEATALDGTQQFGTTTNAIMYTLSDHNNLVSPTHGDTPTITGAVSSSIIQNTGLGFLNSISETATSISR